MRIWTAWLCVAGLLGAGCAAQKSPGTAPVNSTAPIVTTDLRPVGRVALVNMEARFVVLSFPAGPVPPPGERLSITHRGLKIGEVKITGLRRDYDTVADLTEGEANVGDEAKEE